LPYLVHGSESSNNKNTKTSNPTRNVRSHNEGKCKKEPKNCGADPCFEFFVSQRKNPTDYKNYTNDNVKEFTDQDVEFHGL